MLKTGIDGYKGYKIANKNRIKFTITREASDASQTKSKIFGDIEAQM